jgi:hypothetical protein
MTRLLLALAADRVSAALLAAAEPRLRRKRLARVLLRLSLRAGEFGRRMALTLVEGSR